MSLGESENCTDSMSPQIETVFSTQLHIYEPGDEAFQPKSTPTIQAETAPPQEDEEGSRVASEQVDLSTESPGEKKAEIQKVTLSTESPAAKKLGIHQLIPKNLAVTSRPKNRHHTTVVTFPVGLENSSGESRARYSAQGSDVSRDDYDSDGDGFDFGRNRRNKSYRAAVTSLDIEAMTSGTAIETTLKRVDENRESSPGPARSGGRKRTLGRRRNHRGSFKDDSDFEKNSRQQTRTYMENCRSTPRLYQEIRERGLHSTNQDELLEDFVVVEPPAQDQGIVMKSYKQAQLTWSQLPQVKESGILSNITPQERKRQEAIFEIITSEHSYLHSLGILVDHFKNSVQLKNTMTATEHHHLFSNISVIHTVSQRFFHDLEKRHNEQLLIRDISDIVQNHAAHHFEPYIVYCSNETFQQRTLQKLLNNNSAFKDTLKEIETSSECGGLPMLSFLILPMQRVTRLPLLLDTICEKTPAQTAEYFAAVWALKAMSRLVTECNDGARRMERTEQMYTIQKQMNFGKIKPFPLVSASRWLQKRGELAISSEELSIWRAFSNRTYYLFLFNDVLILTKKKSEETFVVLDYATLENVQVELGEDAEVRTTSPSKSNSHYLSFKLKMTKNSEGKSEQTSLVADSRVDRARWIVALKEQKDRIFPCTDGLPQYEVTKTYMPKDPDELGLRQAELVIVLQKEEEWCYGERMRDGVRGWFPANCATEITNPSVMESNVQRMKRLRKETNV